MNKYERVPKEGEGQHEHAPEDEIILPKNFMPKEKPDWVNRNALIKLNEYISKHIDDLEPGEKLKIKLAELYSNHLNVAGSGAAIAKLFKKIGGFKIYEEKPIHGYSRHLSYIAELEDKDQFFRGLDRLVGDLAAKEVQEGAKQKKKSGRPK